MLLYDYCQAVVVDLFTTHRGLIVFVYIVSKLIYGAYLYFQTYDHWWVGLLPLGHLIVKGELSALHIVTQCLYALFAVLALVTYFSIPFCLVALIISVVTDVRFCYMYIDGLNKYAYGFIPFVKYVYMLKEVFVACYQS